ncbi:hypothetical protein [Mucilaginibacter sp.]|uniref:hypothetical protein n=1 Tax=Mucilaginibacter sp. TaxID=1882438 RepID=UPI003D0CA16B
MKRKYLIIILLVVIAIIGFVFYNQIPDMKPIYNIKKLVISNGNEPLYLKSKTWGMTYDSKVIVLSTNEEEEFTADSTKDYIYDGASFLFYKFSNDSLFIYTADKAHTPQVFNSKIQIKQIELDNPAMTKLKGDSAFRSRGLTEFK